MIKLGLDTESLHLWFQNKRMDIFGFIEKAHELGFDGVMINILKDYNLDPEWGTLMSNDPGTLKKSAGSSGNLSYVRRACHKRNYEGTSPESS